jgi:putative DNA methylase
MTMGTAEAALEVVRPRAGRDNGRLTAIPSEESGAESWPRPTFLEDGLPFRELSLVISADRRARDPIYGIHRWWARRPPALLRGLLIASHLDADATSEEFWQAFGSDERPLKGRRVLDPFAGGGSTLIEAARLGADVVGGDVDPLAVSIVRAELEPPEQEPLRKAGSELLEWLTSTFAKLYPAKDDVPPLHYFHVPIVECPNCRHRGPLYRNLMLVRDPGRRGAVVRDDGLTCYCPTCFSLRHLKSAEAVRLRCCGRQHDIWSGTFAGQSYSCPRCSARSSHRDLRTGVAEQRLVAVEETPADGRRRLRQPTRADLEALESARRFLSSRRRRLHLPTGEVQVGHHDDRPASYGITNYEQLFTPRQLLVLGSAWTWVSECDWPKSVTRALEMALSNALATNNRLCGYATDYGRLSALFAVRGYSLPALAVELNPLHPTGGRGTIAACIARIERAAGRGPVRRYTWDPSKQRAVAVDLDLTSTGVDAEVACRSADAFPASETPPDIDLCVFDPPYYDYIAYDELSAFYRAWQEDAHLAGPPLLPGKGNGAEPFGVYLGRCMRAIVARLQAGRPVAFTYHSTNPEAWDAIGEAIDAADLRVTAIWPVRSDGHMGIHSHDGNSEWDLVIVCRRWGETEPREPLFTVDQWIKDVKPLRVSDADRKNMTLAYNMVASRFARLRRKH